MNGSKCVARADGDAGSQSTTYIRIERAVRPGTAGKSSSGREFEIRFGGERQYHRRTPNQSKISSIFVISTANRIDFINELGEIVGSVQI